MPLFYVQRLQTVASREQITIRIEASNIPSQPRRILARGTDRSLTIMPDIVVARVEFARLVHLNILQQADVAILAQAKQAPAEVPRSQH